MKVGIPWITNKFSYAENLLCYLRINILQVIKPFLFLLTKITYSFCSFKRMSGLKYYGFFFEYVSCYSTRSLLKHLQSNLIHAFLKLFIYSVLSFLPRDYRHCKFPVSKEDLWWFSILLYFILDWASGILQNDIRLSV